MDHWNLSRIVRFGNVFYIHGVRKRKTTRVDSRFVQYSSTRTVKVGCNPVKIQSFYLEGGSVPTASPIRDPRAGTITFSLLPLLYFVSQSETWIVYNNSTGLREKTTPDIIRSPSKPCSLKSSLNNAKIIRITSESLIESELISENHVSSYKNLRMSVIHPRIKQVSRPKSRPPSFCVESQLLTVE